MNRTRRFFAFFFISGFCSLAYEIVWLRLSMAAFGADTPTISLFLSCFMAGLGLGCWLAGSAAESAPTAASAIRRYALVEAAIGAGGLLAPMLLRLSHAWLNNLADAAPWQSQSYHAASGLCLLICVLPWTVAMGATLPLGVAALRLLRPSESEKSFSYLYMANALGAAVGILASAFLLIELLGFAGTQWLAAFFNFALAFSAYRLSLEAARSPAAAIRAEKPAAATTPRGVLAMLFLSGLACLGMEVVWTRQYTAYVGTHVYAFAVLLWTYLCETFIGCQIYRSWTKAERTPPALLYWAAAAALGLVPVFALERLLPSPSTTWEMVAPRSEDIFFLAGCAAFLAATLWALRAYARSFKPASPPGPAWIVVGALSLWPAVFADPRLPIAGQFTGGAVRMILGIGPFCAATGFMTAWLVDLAGRGRPGLAAKAYAVNTLGCLAGPLLAGFVLVPRLPERWSLAALSLPFLLYGARSAWERGAPKRWPAASAALAAAVLGVALGARGFEAGLGGVVRRDETATVVAAGEGFHKTLTVNGIGMTWLDNETKMMAHLPLAEISPAPRNALVICFGMGTTFRSALSWGIPVTVVELVPSVPTLFGFFHEDASKVLDSPKARVVIDDGRRYLERSRGSYDVITLDPPPPMEAAGTSLLMSKEFYAAAKKNLRPGGVLQTWVLHVEPATTVALAQAIRGSFANVRAFWIESQGGFFFLASDAPLEALSAEELARRLPAAAGRDLLEWQPSRSVKEVFAALLALEVPIEKLAPADSPISALTDDRPLNEYFLLRRFSAFLRGGVS